MMQKSDNFLAEQLLIMASSTFSEELDPNETIQYVLNTYLPDLKHKPKWVDGSGLSRYNLFTPRSMVKLLQKIKAENQQQSDTGFIFYTYVVFLVTGLA